MSAPTPDGIAEPGGAYSRGRASGGGPPARRGSRGLGEGAGDPA